MQALSCITVSGIVFFHLCKWFFSEIVTRGNLFQLIHQHRRMYEPNYTPSREFEIWFKVMKTRVECVLLGKCVSTRVEWFSLAKFVVHDQIKHCQSRVMKRVHSWRYIHKQIRINRVEINELINVCVAVSRNFMKRGIASSTFVWLFLVAIIYFTSGLHKKEWGKMDNKERNKSNANTR